MYQRLFGVPDMIADMTRSLEMVETYILIYWTDIFGHRKGSGEVWSPGRLPEPPGRYMGLIGPM